MENIVIKPNEARWCLLLPVDSPEIPERIRKEAKYEGLYDKDEYHISILVSRNARVVHEAIHNTSDPQKTTEKMCELARSYSWGYTLGDTYYFHEHTYTRDELLQNGYTDLVAHTRRSIVQLVDCPDLMEFYEEVEKLLHVSLPRPVPHITLFGWSDRPGYLGLGLNSRKEFDKFTVKEL